MVDSRWPTQRRDGSCAAASYYAGLGPARSYQSVAEHYGVRKQAVTKLAVRESWQQRLEDIERKARENVDQRAAESLALAILADRAFPLEVGGRHAPPSSLVCVLRGHGNHPPLRDRRAF